VPVAINISAGQFHTGDLVNQVSESMRATGCDPEMIELEITESMLLGDGDHIQETLQQLSSMGIMLALDDFGTGFSNLAYLQKYPLDVLKIDRIFLADQKRSMLMETILNIGTVLGLRVVAEGVENPVQAEWLISKGCDYLQGFHYSMPLTAADATQYLLDHGTGQVIHTRTAA
jgi:EAL domain-containing protein (putative c-di-GMP-specific phosphodiesterase class I)